MKYLLVLLSILSFIKVEVFAAAVKYTKVNNSVVSVESSTEETEITKVNIGYTQSNTSSSVLSNIKAYLDEVGVDRLSELGTIQVDSSATSKLSNGIYILSKNCSTTDRSSKVYSNMNPLQKTSFTTSSSWSSSCTNIKGQFSSGESYNVVSYTGDDLITSSIIIAKKIVFDEATLKLGEGVNQLYLVAEEIETSNSSITWEKSESKKSKVSQASAGQHTTTAAKCSDWSGESESCKGDDGENGVKGNNGEKGDNGPDIHIVLKKVTKTDRGILQVPQFNISGAHGQDGQDGQDGSKGDTGFRGKDAENDWWKPGCEVGAGHGGQGGNGGNDGKGGNGGRGGNGGDTKLYYVEMENIRNKTIK